MNMGVPPVCKCDNPDATSAKLKSRPIGKKRLSTFCRASLTNKLGRADMFLMHFTLMRRVARGAVSCPSCIDQPAEIENIDAERLRLVSLMHHTTTCDGSIAIMQALCICHISIKPLLACILELHGPDICSAWRVMQVEFLLAQMALVFSS